MIYSRPGYSISWTGVSEEWSGWDGPVFYCRQNSKEFGFQLSLPKGSTGLLRLYIVDPDYFQGGRKETIVVSGQRVGTFEHFYDGPVDWKCRLARTKLQMGKLSVEIVNARKGANAVLSKVEWMEK